MGYNNKINSVSMEEKVSTSLGILHRRLGYIKESGIEKITTSYETNKRKYDRIVEEQREAQRKRELSVRNNHKKASLIFMQRAAEKKRLAAAEEAILKKIRQAKENQNGNSEKDRDGQKSSSPDVNLKTDTSMNGKQMNSNVNSPKNGMFPSSYTISPQGSPKES